MSKSTRPRPGERSYEALRPTTIELNPLKFADGSAIIRCGDTHVLAAATVEPRVPPFRAGAGLGWLTAEYSMLPQATPTRSTREVSRGRPSGRTSEIQRLIGRALRATIDFGALGERTITVDCDVLQADGGTRTASITAGWVAVVLALHRRFERGDLEVWPVKEGVAAVSVGLGSAGDLLLDLDYSEDSSAAVDFNVVALHSGDLIEVQGTGEARSYSRAELTALLDLAERGLDRLQEIQREALAETLVTLDALRHRRRQGPAPAKSEASLWPAPKD